MKKEDDMICNTQELATGKITKLLRPHPELRKLHSRSSENCMAWPASELEVFFSKMTA